ncbi:MAG: hypothetical protein HFJ57_04520 [Clostridia bacterium]|nr:hypothetical protein [Clostridia bacterium]
MGWTHDFVNGFYYENSRREKISPTEYYQRQWKKERLRQGQHYILINICESKIKGDKIYYDIYKWNYYAEDENAPEAVVILSEKEYIKNEKRTCYYRRYKGDYYLSVEVEVNKKLKVDKVEEVCGFFICTVKGRGTLYTEEEFREKFLL